MKIGTKSVLFGAHAFWLHPFFVARAWWLLFGFPWDPRLWVAFFLHDLGYIGKPNMDGPEGEQHVQWGAHATAALFGHWWYEFLVLHSRFWAKSLNKPPSAFCLADKYATYLTPWWLYVPMVRATGEIREYKGIQKHVDDIGAKFEGGSFIDDLRWFLTLKNHLVTWVAIEKTSGRYPSGQRVGNPK